MMSIQMNAPRTVIAVGIRRREPSRDAVAMPAN